MRQLAAPEGRVCHLIRYFGRITHLGGDVAEPQYLEQVEWFGSYAERDAREDVQHYQRRGAAHEMLARAEAMKSVAAYADKHLEAVRWLDAHADPNETLPATGWPYLRAEVDAKGITPHAAATAIDEAATAANATREAERVALRERARALLASL